MSVITHDTFVFWLIGMIIINYAIIVASNDYKIYRRKRSLFYIPLDFIGLGGVLFTGIVMMAAKHLDFTIQNIGMIIVSLIFIVLEVKRAKEFKYVRDENDFSIYKLFAKKILLIELIMVLIISTWMWL
jgi:uncharacterized membrane protein